MALALLDSEERIVISDTDLGVAGGDPETVYTLRPLTLQDYRRIVKEHTKEVLNRRSHQKEPQVDVIAVNDACFDFVLVDWKGIHFRGQPVPCTSEMKTLIDVTRRSALLDAAGMNRVEGAADTTAESFRPA